jgi:hypothetical protein
LSQTAGGDGAEVEVDIREGRLLIALLNVGKDMFPIMQKFYYRSLRSEFEMLNVFIIL